MYRRILVPVDGSPAGEAGLREAVKLAAGRPRAAIRLVHVMEPLPALQGMEVIVTDALIRSLTGLGEKVLRNAKSFVERKGLRADTVFHRRAVQRAADGIVHEAKKWKADVIVMGTHGRRGLSRAVLGSDAESVVQAASVPVVLVRAS